MTLISNYDESSYIYIDKPLYEFLKTVLDFTLSIILLILFFPFFVIIPIVIKLSDGGNIFYVQERVGKNGKKFYIFKFRTMPPQSEIEPVWAKPNDPRCTLIGRYLRKTSIDEVPQLFNILRNELSFVGPRPERQFFIKDHPGLTGKRLNVKPGLTGLAQVNGRYNLSIEQKLKFDLEYIHNRSMFLDIKIIIKTVYKVIICEGAW